MSAIFPITVRYRRLILAIALVLAVVLAVGRRLSFSLDLILVNATFLATLLALSLALLAWLRPRSAALQIQPEVRAFSTEPAASQVYMAVGLTFLASLMLGIGHLSYVGPFWCCRSSSS